MNTTLALAAEFPEFDIQSALARIGSEADWIGLRYVQETTHRRSVRNGKPEDNSVTFERGVMVEARVDGQLAYAGTSDLSEKGLREATRQAVRLARISAPHKAMTFTDRHRPQAVGRYLSPHRAGLDTQSLGEFTDRLIAASRHLKVADKIVNATAEATLVETRLQYASTNGSDIDEQFLLVACNFGVTAQDGGVTQRRSLNGPVARCRQAGLEFFDFEALYAECERAGVQALELLAADDCPNETLDLVLAPDQMLLQIHESIGHPLELDRILGDERNYAGWSFVRPEDFGRLQYGSHLMNVTFDPTVEGQFASYAFDDCGHAASREHLIKDGLLLRGLGSLESQSRLGLPGVANFRAASWNRAPIDRMANINLEPGSGSLDDIVAAVERGVYMESNISWSIDDYRNKFQFGCEYARLIENGRFTQVLKNPNYRGVTVPFWQSLTRVGGTSEMFGTPYCGKGEPSQIIRVGHASPPCLFTGVEVFGGGL
ncbi:TldD/PmbA family protein [Methylococcus sp. EFPC2]|uniref:TldD/PmbA family protein n=1 Tax=Methylococcus sp. EFPC2 TaxID=2812648 RepID=UPI0019672CF1|nr:TldD/PmbA family protein [Methylococcus sp. EFPC2]QSA96908.1 TldD/PmbA family protein [Methylococcus sp. EFPC2]